MIRVPDSFGMNIDVNKLLQNLREKAKAYYKAYDKQIPEIEYFAINSDIRGRALDLCRLEIEGLVDSDLHAQGGDYQDAAHEEVARLRKGKFSRMKVLEERFKQDCKMRRAYLLAVKDSWELLSDQFRTALEKWGDAIDREDLEWKKFHDAAEDAGWMDNDAIPTAPQDPAPETSPVREDNGVDKEPPAAKQDAAVVEGVRAVAENAAAAKSNGGRGTGKRGKRPAIKIEVAAAYMKKGTRTLQRWEKNPGLVPDEWAGYSRAVRMTGTDWEAWKVSLGMREGTQGQLRNAAKRLGDGWSSTHTARR